MSPPRSPQHPPWDSSVLVVDDDVFMRGLIEQTLEAEGYRVWTATRAGEGQELLDELGGSLDLVITDTAMPGGLGSELGTAAREGVRSGLVTVTASCISL